MTISEMPTMCEDCGQDVRPTELHIFHAADGASNLLPRCIDRKACAALVKAQQADARAQALEDVEHAKYDVLAARDNVTIAEGALADTIRFVLSEGVPVTAVAQAAGLSRERVYQIRDGRR